jgi:hypothetical protein
MVCEGDEGRQPDTAGAVDDAGACLGAEDKDDGALPGRRDGRMRRTTSHHTTHIGSSMLANADVVAPTLATWRQRSMGCAWRAPA